MQLASVNIFISRNDWNTVFLVKSYRFFTVSSEHHLVTFIKVLTFRVVIFYLYNKKRSKVPEQVLLQVPTRYFSYLAWFSLQVFFSLFYSLNTFFSLFYLSNVLKNLKKVNKYILNISFKLITLAQDYYHNLSFDIFTKRLSWYNKR